MFKSNLLSYISTNDQDFGETRGLAEAYNDYHKINNFIDELLYDELPQDSDNVSSAQSDE